MIRPITREYILGLATDRINGPLQLIPKSALLLLSFLYGAVIKILIFLRQANTRRLPCKVISVGNITCGGTGKTPLVEYIARFLKEQGHRAAVVSRGYKRKITNCQLPITNYESMGDEPSMLFRKLGDIPVIVDADRIRGVNRAVRDYSVDTVILDDAMQQWHLKKDLEIVLIDAGNPFGNRCLIPRGIMREPLSGLKRADLFLLNGRADEQVLMRLKGILDKLNPRAAVFEAIRKPVCFLPADSPQGPLALSALKDKKVILFSGIGNPASFEEIIKSLEIDIIDIFEFSDHHRYTQKDLDIICRSCADKDADTLITTEKDATRLKGLSFAGRLEVYVLKINIEIKDEAEFRNRLLQLYSG